MYGLDELAAALLSAGRKACRIWIPWTAKRKTPEFETDCKSNYKVDYKRWIAGLVNIPIRLDVERMGIENVIKKIHGTNQQKG